MYMEDEMGGTCGKNREKRNVYRLLVGKPEGPFRDRIECFGLDWFGSG
jgi:hypothetical protein